MIDYNIFIIIVFIIMTIKDYFNTREHVNK